MRSPVRLVLLGLVVAAGCLFASMPAAGQEGGVAASQMTMQGRTPCPVVAYFNVPVEKGCEFLGASDHMRLRIFTPFGSFELGDCRMYVAGHVAPDGSTWFDNIEFAGDNPCFDFRPCKIDGSGREAPWLARIGLTAADDAHLDVAVCLDTRVGWFEAPVRMRLETEDGYLRAIAMDQLAIGETGLEMDGRLTVEERDIRLRGAPRDELGDQLPDLNQFPEPATGDSGR